MRAYLLIVPYKLQRVSDFKVNFSFHDHKFTRVKRYSTTTLDGIKLMYIPVCILSKCHLNS